VEGEREEMGGCFGGKGENSPSLETVGLQIKKKGKERGSKVGWRGVGLKDKDNESIGLGENYL